MTVAIPLRPEPLVNDITALEEVIGILPLEYLEFARSHDGATPEKNLLAIGIDNESGVRRFIPVAEARALINKIERFPSAAAPLAEDDCGNYFYIKVKSGAVFFWDHEVDDNDIEVAPTLTQFLLSLLPFDSSAVKLSPRQVKVAWINPAFKAQFN